MKKIRNTSRQAPLTPDYSAITAPVPFGTSSVVVQEHVTPDIAVESFLFRSYLFQKERADRLAKHIGKLESILAERGKHNRMRKFASKLTVGQ